MKHELIAGYSLLYEVKGSDPSLTPFLLMGHLDVVPVPDPSVWDVPPFAGTIHDGFIYGRGTIDDKHTSFVRILLNRVFYFTILIVQYFIVLFISE